MRELLAYLTAHLDEMRSDLRQLVELESPSDDPTSLGKCAAFIADRARVLTGGQVRLIDDAEGPHLDIAAGDEPAAPILLLGHFDTVWPLGTIRDWPYRDDGQTATGPGVFDMKAGLIQGLWAISAARTLSRRRCPLRILFNSDEEIQSVLSRPIIEAAARTARAVLVLEPSQAGALKTARKGVGRFEITIHGRAAHAGVEPWAGRSAISELARVIERLDALTNFDAGVSVNVGVVRGGSRANVVAAEAQAVADVRVTDAQQADEVSRAILGLTPSMDGLDITVTGAIVRPPMSRTPRVAGLFALAQQLGRRIDMNVTETSSGGGSDANFCGALGLPVLDGLGAVGGGAHAVDEHVRVAAMAPRAALVAGLIEAIAAT